MKSYTKRIPVRRGLSLPIKQLNLKENLPMVDSPFLSPIIQTTRLFQLSDTQTQYCTGTGTEKMPKMLWNLRNFPVEL